MKTRCIVTARMESSRLPGKSLLPILDVPLIGRLLERLARATSLDEIIVATPSTAANDPLAQYVQTRGYGVYRGASDDVLDRVYQATHDLDRNRVVLVTGDCPLIDPELVDHTVRFFVEGGYDFAGNAVEPTFPDGLDVAVFTFAFLEQAWQFAGLRSEREHVTRWMKQSRTANIGSFTGTPDRAALRWTVDEPRDLDFVRAVYARLYPVNPAFTSDDIVALLTREPNLLRLNAGIARNDGLRKSLEAEA
jgi:spore coat polysaccharide biosynthesis protein SpsF